MLFFFHFILDGLQIELKFDNQLHYTRTQRGRNMLVFQGYKYVENRQSAKNTFWRCSSYVKYSCRATIVTSKDPNNVFVRLAGSLHSHAREPRLDVVNLHEPKLE